MWSGWRRAPLWLVAVTIASRVLTGCAEEGSDESMEDDVAEDASSDDGRFDAELGPGREAGLAPPDAARDSTGPANDAGDALDAGPTDGGAADADAMDASADGSDSAPQDAGVDAGADAGKDAGSLDAGKDASTADASTSDASTTDASVPDASKPDAAAANTFSSVYTILASHCTGCHGSSGALNLGSKQRAYDELTGGPLGPSMGLAEGPACSGQGRRRVVPGDPSSSLLMQKLSGSPPCGDAMPPGDTLSAAQLAEIGAWIAAGALND